MSKPLILTSEEAREKAQRILETVVTDFNLGPAVIVRLTGYIACALQDEYRDGYQAGLTNLAERLLEGQNGPER